MSINIFRFPVHKESDAYLKDLKKQVPCPPICRSFHRIRIFHTLVDEPIPFYMPVTRNRHLVRSSPRSPRNSPQRTYITSPTIHSHTQPPAQTRAYVHNPAQTCSLPLSLRQEATELLRYVHPVRPPSEPSCSQFSHRQPSFLRIRCTPASLARNKRPRQS